MVLESDHSTEQVLLLCPLFYEFKQVTVPHMNAVKGANGKSGFLRWN